MTKATSILLKKVGVPNHIRGYEYIGEAIEMVVKDRKQIYSITKTLYPSIAKKLKTTSSRVERGIRFAIESCFNTLSPDLIEEVFGNTIPYDKGKPTNSQFIATLSDLIIQEN